MYLGHGGGGEVLLGLGGVERGLRVEYQRQQPRDLLRRHARPVVAITCLVLGKIETGYGRARIPGGGAVKGGSGVGGVEGGGGIPTGYGGEDGGVGVHAAEEVAARGLV